MKWEKLPIASACSGIYDGPHATPPESKSGAVFLGISNFVNGRLDLSDIRYISESDLPKWTKRVVPQKHDIVFSYEATLNLYAIIPDDFRGCLGRRMALIRVDESKAHYKYLYYYFYSPAWRAVISEHTVIGATVDRIPLISFPNFPIELPDLPTQHRIASILSAYDDLIENNRRQIKLLEEAAQRLYREWFVELRFPGHEDVKIVDGLPEGWQVVFLGDVIEFDPKVLLAKDRMKQTVPMAALSTSSMVIDQSLIENTMSNSGSKFKNGDTLLARITPCLENGKTAFVDCLDNDEGAVGSTEFIVMRSKKLNPYMVYCIARSDSFRTEAINSMTGSDGRQRAQKDKLKVLSYILPQQSLIDRFEQLTRPCFDKIKVLNRQISSLVAVRDRLIPKLMNGEIEV